MIAPKHVIIGHTTFEKINLNHSYYFFDDIKNIDLNSNIDISKKCMMLLVMKSNISQCKVLIIRILIRSSSLS